MEKVTFANSNTNNLLVKLEKALYKSGIPWVKGIREICAVEGDGIHFNTVAGKNIVAVTNDGITIPSLVLTQFGWELYSGGRTFYTYEDLYIMLVDIQGPYLTNEAIKLFKELATTV